MYVWKGIRVIADSGKVERSMKLLLTNTKTNKDIKIIEIEWGYVTNDNGKTSIHFVTKENYKHGIFDYETIIIENDNMMLHLLP